MNFEASIGLEVHVQLNTASKMFCACSTAYSVEPNTNVCPGCLGHPGALPVINEEAVKKTVLTGLMLGCRINEYSRFDRKNYFYPDASKNYQISQNEIPLCLGGQVDIDVGGVRKRIRLTRIHIEEDVGKSVHFSGNSGLDFNRSGLPLMEIVSEPDMHSPEDVFAFLQALKQVLEYAGVSDCNLEEGNMRFDVNCSLSEEGSSVLGVRTELKNLNTLRGAFNSVKYEIARQKEVLMSGGKIIQETRRWEADTGVTHGMRVKERAVDYRYFPDPDLLPISLDRAVIEEWRSHLPEMPSERRERLVKQYGLPPYDAGVLAADKKVADFFEATAAKTENFKAVSNWMMTDMLRLLSERDMDIDKIPVTPDALAELICLVDSGKLNSNTARDVFNVLFEEGGFPEKIVAERGLAQMNDTGEIAKMVDKAIADNASSVNDYRGGKKAALKFLIGNVMKQSRGKANPSLVTAMFEERLGK